VHQASRIPDTKRKLLHYKMAHLNNPKSTLYKTVHKNVCT